MAYQSTTASRSRARRGQRGWCAGRASRSREASLPGGGSGAPSDRPPAARTTVPAVLHPVGPLSAGVYWRRRLVVLLVLLAVLGGAGWVGLDAVDRPQPGRVDGGRDHRAHPHRGPGSSSGSSRRWRACAPPRHPPRPSRPRRPRRATPAGPRAGLAVHRRHDRPRRPRAGVGGRGQQADVRAGRHQHVAGAVPARPGQGAAGARAARRRRAADLGEQRLLPRGQQRHPHAGPRRGGRVPDRVGRADQRADVHRGPHAARPRGSYVLRGRLDTKTSPDAAIAAELSCSGRGSRSRPGGTGPRGCRGPAPRRRPRRPAGPRWSRPAASAARRSGRPAGR